MFEFVKIVVFFLDIVHVVYVLHVGYSSMARGYMYAKIHCVSINWTTTINMT